MKLFEMKLNGYSTVKGPWSHTLLVPAASAAEAQDSITEYLMKLGGKIDWTVESLVEVAPMKTKEVPHA